MPSHPWWERHPGRLEHELACLDYAGVSYRIDESAKKGGLLRLRAAVDVPDHGPLDLVVTFPDNYPYARPEVAAQDLDLPHHQHPFGKNLCLIGRDTRYWRTQDTLAWLLTEQLPKTIAAGASNPSTDAERRALPEQRQAEPYTTYYTSFTQGAMILVDSDWTVPAEIGSGDLLVGFDGPFPPEPASESRSLGAVLRLASSDGSLTIEADNALQARFARTLIQGRWSRLGAAPAVDDAGHIWRTAETADPGPAPRPISGAALRAVLVPEELAWRKEGTGWLFVIRQHGRLTAAPPRRGRRRGPLQRPQMSPTTHWLIRAGRGGRSDLSWRVRELRGLQDKRVVVAGIGAIGGTISDQLARAGLGHIRTIDCDVLEPGNLVRHAARFHHLGQHKAQVGATLAAERSPYIKALGIGIRLGGVRTSTNEPSDVDVVQEALADADLLVDATAELGLQQWLAAEARERDVPYLGVSATNGAWGGLVVLLEPDAAACWLCLQLLMNAGTIPPPPEAPTDLVQPPGCANPTFTGAGFDIDEVALHAVRTAVALLHRGTRDGYPAPAAEVAVLTLRTTQTTPVVPSWAIHALRQHPDCSAH